MFCYSLFFPFFFILYIFGEKKPPCGGVVFETEITENLIVNYRDFSILTEKYVLGMSFGQKFYKSIQIFQKDIC